MKSFVVFSAMAVTCIGTVTAWAMPYEALVAKRQVAGAQSILLDLYSNIQQYTGVINMTAAGLTADSTAAENATAAQIINDNFKAINDAVAAATVQTSSLASTPIRRQLDVPVLSNSSETSCLISNGTYLYVPVSNKKLRRNVSKLSARQTDATIAALVENLLLEVGGTLDNVIGALGLGALIGPLGSLHPLLCSLAALLLSLEVVVDNLLIVVGQILDGLLTGLAIGLAGLNL